MGKRSDLGASTRGGGKRFEGMESGSTQEEVKEGENGGIFPTAHRHNLTLQLISELPPPSMPDEMGVGTPEQTHWTVV